jgi:hypothetical protein
MSPTTHKIALGIVAAVAIAALIISLRSRNPLSSPPAESTAEAVSTPTASPDFGPEVDTLKKQLARERGARQRAEAEAAALRTRPVAQPAAQATSLPVTLSKVDDVGKHAGTFFPAMGELNALTARDPATLSPDEKRRLLQLQRDHAKLLGALPEITGFQDDPEQYGRFFRSMFQEAAGLDEAQAAQVEEYMRQRAAMMNEQGLNAAKEPTDSALEEAWEERRDSFNEQTAQGLKAILPPGVAEKVGFGPGLMEFLEMDFDKINPQSVVQTRVQ